MTTAAVSKAVGEEMIDVAVIVVVSHDVMLLKGDVKKAGGADVCVVRLE
jgi:hypothetical protein